MDDSLTTRMQIQMILNFSTKQLGEFITWCSNLFYNICHMCDIFLHMTESNALIDT